MTSPLTRRRRALPRAAALAAAALALVTGCGGGGSSPSQQLPAGEVDGALAAPPAAAPDAAAPQGSALAPPAGQWWGYHRDPSRAGYAADTPRLGRLAKAWGARLDAAVYASPLVVGSLAVVATEANSVYGLDLRTGAVRWRARLGTPVRGGSLPCGNVDPLGITGTPAYDPQTRRVFAVATTRDARGQVDHQLVGLDAATGRVAVKRDVDPPRQATDVLNQRGALVVSKGVVYVPYGGLAGDCGEYHGHVVGVRADGRGPLLSYRVPTPREAGIWAPSGVAADAAGTLYVAVGNGAAGQDEGYRDAPYDGSDSVTALSPSLRRTGLFAPSGWRQENAVDADLGSTGPLLVGKDLVWAQGKTGTGYVLRRSGLTGIGTQAGTVRGACDRQFGGAAAHGLVVYASCTDGVRQLLLSADGRRSRLGWKAPSSVSGSPVVGGGAVFALDVAAGVLHALDERSGRDVQRVPVGSVTRFATPALSGSLVLVPTTTGVVAVRGA